MSEPSRILLVEDEMIVAMTLEDMLMDLGHQVVSIATHLDMALEAARKLDFDLAFLDINLNGRHSLPVAEVLRERDIPIVFQTGYGSQGIDTSAFKAAIITKPFVAADVERAIDAARSA
jgi:CheY-like chemotaxis protein